MTLADQVTISLGTQSVLGFFVPYFERLVIRFPTPPYHTFSS